MVRGKRRTQTVALCHTKVQFGKNKAWICEPVDFTILRHPGLQGAAPEPQKSDR